MTPEKKTFYISLDLSKMSNSHFSKNGLERTQMPWMSTILGRVRIPEPELKVRPVTQQLILERLESTILKKAHIAFVKYWKQFFYDVIWFANIELNRKIIVTSKVIGTCIAVLFLRIKPTHEPCRTIHCRFQFLSHQTCPKSKFSVFFAWFHFVMQNLFLEKWSAATSTQFHVTLSTLK